MLPVKALTLHQPWASLIAVGAKTIETRSWSTKYRGPIAIHAAARHVVAYEHRNVNDDLPRCIDLVAVARYWEWMEHPNDSRHGGLFQWAGPLGAVVATGELVDVVPSEWVAETFRTDWDGWTQYADRKVSAGKMEFLLGDLTHGRFAWLLDNVNPLPEPIPAKGRQGLWEWKS